LKGIDTTISTKRLSTTLPSDIFKSPTLRALESESPPPKREPPKVEPPKVVPPKVEPEPPKETKEQILKSNEEHQFVLKGLLKSFKDSDKK